MTFRTVLVALVLAGALCSADAPPAVIRGKLTQQEGTSPALATGSKLVSLDGDKDTQGELRGHFTGPARFTVGPIHHKAVHVLRDGKKLLVTYWCDTCAIRTYTPGKCWCCQQETDLDLRDSDDRE
jgi:hypothetical protein